MDSPHLEDEILSAVIDDDPAAPAVATARLHLEGCAPCQARLAQLRHVVVVIGRPPEPAGSEQQEAHLRVALAVATVRPIETARHRRARPLALAAAASILVLLSAGGLVVALRGGFSAGSKATIAASRSHPSASGTGGVRGGSAGSTAAGSPAADSAAAQAAAGPIAVDYGDQSDLGTLSTLIADSLRAQGPTTPVPRAAAPASGANTLAAPITGPDCKPAAQTDADRAGAGAQPALTATLRWDSQPAHAFAFRLAGGNLLIEVRRQSDCFLLASRTT